MADMNRHDELVCLSKFLEQWNALLERLGQVSTVNNRGQALSNDFNPNEESQRKVIRENRKRREPDDVDESNHDDHDPFDCSDLSVISVYNMAEENIIPRSVKAWQQLDERKITVPVLSNRKISTNSSDGMESPTQKPNSIKCKNPSWYEKHVRFPDGFDYANRNEEAPPANISSTFQTSNKGDACLLGDRVISLQDPTQTTSYEHELWNLFDSIPTSSEIDEALLDGMALTSTKTLHDCLSNALTPPASRKNKQDVKKLNAALSSSGIYSIRMSDRHGFPWPMPLTKSPQQPKQGLAASVDGTITFELWKRPYQERSGQPPTPDSSRMIMEFLGTQSLLDVHLSILDMTHDPLWKFKVQQQESSFFAGSTNSSKSSQTKNQTNEDDDSCGFFFIEGSFYTTGKDTDAKYIAPIQDWILSGSKEEQEARAKHLGLTLNARTERPTTERPTVDLESQMAVSFDKCPVLSMSETCLETIRLAFGKRYLHVVNGNMECSLFLIDMACRERSNTSDNLSYPILHDIWTPGSSSNSDCEACQQRLATLVTRSSCQITSGQRFLCEACAKELCVPKEELERFSVWQQVFKKENTAGGGES